MGQLKTLTSVVWLCLFGFALAACSGGHNPDLTQGPISGKQTVISGTSFELLESTDRDTAAGASKFLLASQPLADARFATHFRLTLELQPGGHAALSAFGEKTATSATSLKNAVVIRFERPLATAPLSVSITASGTTDDWSAFFKGLDPAKPLQLGIDIHNDESGEAHVLVWNLEAGDHPNLPTLIDSALDVNGAPGKGFGRHWGVLLSDAELQLARLTPPRYEH